MTARGPGEKVLCGHDMLDSNSVGNMVVGTLQVAGPRAANVPSFSPAPPAAVPTRGWWGSLAGCGPSEAHL
jgi:hypothetical protein